MIKVSKINWLSEEAKEAEVCLFDGKFSIITFSHPFKHSIGHIIDLPLFTLNAKEIYSLNNIETFSVEREGDTFEHKFSGRVINKESNQILVGEFIIQIDVSLPNDINIGDYVSFICDRIDLY
ncbi:MAG: hypothetical protein SF052_12390 [Bacteroidia bacterium]|nr:hypothetical protein [Bacteroidia bacterium]